MNLYSYNEYSNSAKVLSEALDIKRIKHDRSRFRGSPAKTVLNWGCTELPEEVQKCRLIQHPSAIRNASNKLRFFQQMGAAGNHRWLPKFTTDREEAAKWIADGRIVVCRTVLAGHSGEGIVIAETADQLVNAPLYVEYRKKKDEFRIHVYRKGDDAVVFYEQRKARRNDVENPNWQVRNHQNGFIYAHENIQVPDVVRQAAIECLKITDLHFGAVDVIYNDHSDRAYVLEINTAPGLSGLSIEKYRDMIKEIV